MKAKCDKCGNIIEWEGDYFKENSFPCNCKGNTYVKVTK